MCYHYRVEKRLKEDNSNKDEFKRKSKPLPSMPRPPSPPNTTSSLKYELFSIDLLNIILIILLIITIVATSHMGKVLSINLVCLPK